MFSKRRDSSPRAGARNEEHGQVLVLTALMMVLLLSMAALALNGSYLFYQHTSMQDQVDKLTLSAAANGCSLSPPLDGMRVGRPRSGPYAGRSGYCQGTYERNTGGLFGTILRFPGHVSVQAVATSSNRNTDTFALLGLDPNNDAASMGGGCSVYFSGTMAIDIYGNVISDGPMTDASACRVGNNGAIIEPPSTFKTHVGVSDPFGVDVPLSATAPAINTCGQAGGCTAANTPSLSCLPLTITVPSGATYYQPSDPSGLAEVPWVKTSGAQLVYLPYCQGTTAVAGAYLVDQTIAASSNGVVTSYDSAFLLSPTATVDIRGQAVVNWNSPVDGPYYDHALSESDLCSPPPPTSITIAFSGGSGFTVNGLIDTPCGSVVFNGGGNSALNGSAVGWTIKLNGNSGSLSIHPRMAPLSVQGTVLVQ